MPAYKTLRLSEVEIDEKNQPRECGLDESHVEELAEEYRKDDHTIPPPVAWELPDGRHRLSQGNHRAEAAKRAGLTELKFAVRTGTEDECFEDAQCSNRDHGLKRTNADKRRAATNMVRRFPQLSDRCIAEKLGITNKTVGEARRRLESGEEIPHLDNREGRDGKSYQASGKVEPTPEPLDEGDDNGDGTVKLFDQPAEAGPAAEREPSVAPTVGSAARPSDLALSADQLVRAMDAARRNLLAIKKEVETLQRMPAAKGVNLQGVIGEISRGGSSLWSQRPAHLCPYCKGDGRDRKEAGKSCSCCYGIGFVPKWVHTQGEQAIGGAA